MGVHQDILQVLYRYKYVYDITLSYIYLVRDLIQLLDIK